MQYHGLKNGEGKVGTGWRGGGLMYVYNVKVEVKSVPVAATTDQDERHARFPLLPEYESCEVGRRGRRQEKGTGEGGGDVRWKWAGEEKGEHSPSKTPE